MSRSKVPYVNACYECSKDLPLDVELELTDFPSSEAYLIQEICRAATENTDESEHEDVRDRILEQDWRYHSTRIDTELSRALGSLLGPNEAHVERWESIVISLPSDGDPLWRRIRRSCSSVVKLEVTNRLVGWDERGIDPADLPHLPLIRDLRFFGTPEQTYAQIAVAHKTRKTLEIVIGESILMQVSILSALTNLHTLILRIRDLDATPHSFNLPQLEALTLYAVSGHVGPWRISIECIQAATWKLL